MPRRATKLFTDDQKRDVERAIAAAEARTSAEIVVAVATRSGRYDRAEDAVGLALALLAVGVAALVWRVPPADPNAWGHPWRVDLHPAIVLAIFAGAAVAGAALATAFPVLARPLISRRHREAEVKAAGAGAFHSLRVRDTSEARGVLLYVSLYERMVWVVGDDAINAALAESDFDGVRDRVLAGFKRGEPVEGLTGAVAMAGELLAEHFPRDERSANELPDTLHLLD